MKTKNDLEALFEVGNNKAKLEALAYKNTQIERWNRDLAKVNEIYDKLSFLNDKGIKIEKVFCTEFNEAESQRGFFPILRFPQFLAVFKPVHDGEFDFAGNANGRLTGEFTCESFVKKVSGFIR